MPTDYRRREEDPEARRGTQPAGPRTSAGAGVGLPTGPAAQQQSGPRKKPAAGAGALSFYETPETPIAQARGELPTAPNQEYMHRPGGDIVERQKKSSSEFDYGQALQASDATQTGFLNFDRFAAANQGISRREAKRVNDLVNAQARKALDAARAARDAYARQLKTLDSAGTFDGNGNWAPDSDGAQVAGYQGPGASPGILSPDGNDFGEEGGLPTEADNAAAQDAYRQQLQQQMEELKRKAETIPGFTDSAEYKTALEQALKADQMLGALTGGQIDTDGDGEPDEFGLNVLSGGRGFDALLLGQAGRPGFRKTVDKYGDDGLRGSLGDYTAAAQNSAIRTSNSLNQQYADYQQALGSFDKQLMDDADAKKAAEEAKKNAPKTMADLVKSAKDQGRSMTWDEVGKRGATNNARKLAYFRPFQSAIGEADSGWVGGPGQDAWVLAEKKMAPLGLTGEAASKYWDEFRNSLPEDLRNWVNGLISWDGDMGESHALANSDEDWVFFQELFDAYVKENPPKKG